MKTDNISIRIPVTVIEFLTKYASQHDWSRNHLISKILTEKYYELSGDLDG